MRENSLIQFSSGRYYQGCGVLTKLGEEASLLGKTALLVVDDTVWEKTKKKVCDSLEKAGVRWVRYVFSGGCTPSHYHAAQTLGQKENCELVVGLGGGRAVDTAKIAADLMGVRCIAVPTNLATCASTAWLSVHYNEDGSMIGNYWTRYSVFCTLVDLEIAGLDCPVRYTAAGILDAMSKYPEITYNLIIGGRFQKNAFSEAAALMARQMFEELLEHGENCLQKIQKGIIDSEVEDCAAMAVSIAGITSVMACGGKQAAVCHSLYAWVCQRYPEIAKEYVHGEIVAASMIYQLVLDGESQEQIERLSTFIHNLKAPSCMRELGISCNKNEIEDMLSTLFNALNINDEMERTHMRQNVSYLVDGKAD